MPTYYVDGAVGDDANAGTSEGSGNAWATIDHAMNTVAPLDKVWVKATGVYSETPNIDTIGTSGQQIIFEGYAETTGDNGKVTITGVTNCLTSSLSGGVWYIFKNFIFTGASSHGVSMVNTDAIGWYNCEFTNNGGSGLTGDNTHCFYNCVATNNSSYGIDVDSSLKAVGCIAHSNGLNQINADFAVAVQGNLVYGVPATRYGLRLQACAAVVGNTVDCGGNSTTTAIGLDNDVDSVVIDNIVVGANIGINYGASPQQAATFLGYNLFNSNNIDYDSSGELIGVNDVSGDPLFTDSDNGDYTIGSSSPAKDAGLQPGGIT